MIVLSNSFITQAEYKDGRRRWRFADKMRRDCSTEIMQAWRARWSGGMGSGSSGRVQADAHRPGLEIMYEKREIKEINGAPKLIHKFMTSIGRDVKLWRSAAQLVALGYELAVSDWETDWADEPMVSPAVASVCGKRKAETGAEMLDGERAPKRAC